MQATQLPLEPSSNPEAINNRLRPYATEIGLRYALATGLIGFLQIFISFATVKVYEQDIVIVNRQFKALIQYSKDGNYGLGIPQPELLIAPIGIAILTCLIGGIASLIMSRYASRETMISTQSVQLARRSGMVNILVGGLIWLGIAVVLSLIIGYDGAMSVPDTRDSVPFLAQHIGAATLVLIRGLPLWGISLLFTPLFNENGVNAGYRHNFFQNALAPSTQ
jgi:hypothetical protein